MVDFAKMTIRGLLAEHSRMPSFDHQIIGVRELVKWAEPDRGRVCGGCFWLQDEMGNGKTKQCIDAAQILYWHGRIHRVMVVAPAAVRGVWFDKDLGELARHLWKATPARIIEFHKPVREWHSGPALGETRFPKRMEWLITNYDYIRDPARLLKLIQFVAQPGTLLIADESSALKNPQAKQTKAFVKLRKAASRVWLLNGTPISHSPMDVHSQSNVMDVRILNAPTKIQFRSQYAIMGGRGPLAGKIIIGWKNLDVLQKKLAPYVLRRLKKDCLDLPEKMPPITWQVRLTPATWQVYKQMRDEMVAWLTDQTVAVAPQAVTKILRLAQITSGFIGGIEDSGLELELPEPGDRPAWLETPELPFSEGGADTQGAFPAGSGRPLPGWPDTLRELGAEKLELFLERLDGWLEQDPTFKLVVWSRHRYEIFRALKAIQDRFPTLTTGVIIGGQKKDEREAAKRLLHPDSSPKDQPVVVLGTPATGSMGLNFTAAHNVLELSYDFNLKDWLQSQDRVHRPGQVHTVNYYNIEAVGPNGQQTIDHFILKARTNKWDLATMTTQAWVQALRPNTPEEEAA